MLRRCLLPSFSLLAMLAGCGSEPQGDAASTAPSTQPSPGADKATLMAKPVVDFADIAVPEVGGIDSAAAARINATLATLRDRAVEAAKQCRASAGSMPFQYRYAAQPSYNDRGVLSLRITGEGQCGGAKGSTIVAAHTFDLATGADVNVVDASGKTPAELAALAVQGYAGAADCKTFLAGDQASLDSAFVTDRGVGVNYAVNVGAAESCAAEPGLAPWTALAGGLKAPLAIVAETAR